MAKQSNTETQPMQRVERSTAGLRELLFDEIDRVRSGISTAKEANAVATLSRQILATTSSELAVHKFWIAAGTRKLKAPSAPPQVDFSQSESEQDSPPQAS